MIIYLSEDLKNYRWNKTKEISKELVFKLINQFNDDVLKYEVGIAISTIILNGKRGIYIFFKAKYPSFNASHLNTFIKNNKESWYLGEDSFVLNTDVLNLKSKNVYQIKEKAFSYNFYPKDSYVHLDYYILGDKIKDEKNYTKYKLFSDLFELYSLGEKESKKLGITSTDKEAIYDFTSHIAYSKNQRKHIEPKYINFAKSFFKKHEKGLMKIIRSDKYFDDLLYYVKSF